MNLWFLDLTVNFIISLVSHIHIHYPYVDIIHFSKLYTYALCTLLLIFYLYVVYICNHCYFLLQLPHNNFSSGYMRCLLIVYWAAFSKWITWSLASCEKIFISAGLRWYTRSPNTYRSSALTRSGLQMLEAPAEETRMAQKYSRNNEQMGYELTLLQFPHTLKPISWADWSRDHREGFRVRCNINFYQKAKSSEEAFWHLSP